MTSPRVLAALRLSFGVSLLAAAINAIMGLIVAWALARYEFPGRRLVDAAVDLPFALPTAVAGIALASIYAPNGWVGALVAPLGIKIAYTPLGILVALVAVGLPFIVRSVQPVLQDFDAEVEEAALTLTPRRLAADALGRPAGYRARACHRLLAGLRAGRRRIRLGDLHRRQHAGPL